MKLSDFRLKLKGQELMPLIVGGMGVDISTSALALELCRLGAIGHISDAMAPYVSDKKYSTRFQNQKFAKFRHLKDTNNMSDVKWDVESVYTAQVNHVSKTMNAKRGSGQIWINIMEKLQMGAPKETLQARVRGAMEGGIDGITLSAGLHLGTLKLVEDHPRFNDVLFGIIVSSARALKIFLQSSAKANRQPDYVIVEGPLAGGHLGFGLDWEKYDLRTIFNEVKDLLKELNLSIPLIPAGGIFTGQDAVNYLQEGASAVQVATRFTISQECGLPTHVKQEYIRAHEEDIVVNMTSPAGYPMRMLNYSPSLTSNIKPQCEALGYMLDRNGNCAYRDAYEAAPLDANGEKVPMTEKMCICYHFMKYNCYTCGHYVYRLKDTTTQLPDGSYYLPKAEEIFHDYMENLQFRRIIPEEIVQAPAAVAV